MSENAEGEITGTASAAPDLMELLANCHQRLEECLQSGDWQGAQEAVGERDSFIQELLSLAVRESPGGTEEMTLAESRQVRWLLEDILSSNERLVEELKDRIHSQRDKIKGIQKGRNTLGLYKSSHRDSPRFLNRMG